MASGWRIGPINGFESVRSVWPAVRIPSNNPESAKLFNEKDRRKPQVWSEVSGFLAKPSMASARALYPT